MVVRHLVSVGFTVATALMRIGRIAVKKGFLAVVAFDDFDGWSKFKLNAQETLGDLRKVFDRSQPSADGSRLGLSRGLPAGVP